MNNSRRSGFGLLITAMILMPVLVLAEANEGSGLQLAPFEAAAVAETILEQVESAWNTPLEAESEIAERLLQRQILNYIQEGCDLVLADDAATEKQVLQAVENKMQALGVLARSGDPAAPAKALAMARDLAEDDRPLVAREGKLILLSSRLRELVGMNLEQKRAFVDELLALLTVAEIGDREIEISAYTASMIAQLGENVLAQSIYEKLAVMTAEAKSPTLRSQTKVFAGAARRLGLVGNEMQVTGKTLDGTAFHLKDWKGKVILVQFWASWCTYCLQETPHILQMYNLYHENGFEVVGVNLDEAAARAREIVQDQQLPWPQLFSDDPAQPGMQHPLAIYYGINSLPQCILINREGKVVTLQARGKELEDHLSRLFPAQ